MINITLAKAKYRHGGKYGGKLLRRGSNFGGLGGPIDPKDDWQDGTWVYTAGRFAAKERRNPPRAKVTTVRPRRKAYGPW